MLDKPQISVVIPCFNGEPWVADAIDSVLAQGRDDVEILVVDDGSEDRTIDVLKRYENRVTALRQANGGVVAARRSGVARARGAFVKFLDADDVVPSGALASLSALSREFPDEALIGRSVDFCDSTRVVRENSRYGIGYKPAHLELVKKEFLLTQATSSSLWCIPREAFERYDLFGSSQARMGEEFEFCRNLIAAGIPVRHIDVIVSKVRIHDSPTRLSRSQDEERHIQQAREIQYCLHFIRDRIPGYSSEAIALIARLCWSRGRICLRSGCHDAGRLYFEIAREADPSVGPVGSRTYRALCAVLGPRISEAFLYRLKRATAVHMKP